jgi:nitrite reductase (NO-forming)
METSLTQPTVRRRAPLSALVKLTIAALVGVVLALVYVQTLITGEFAPDLTGFAVITAIVASSLLTGWRWTPLLGTLISSLVIVGNSDKIIYDITHPENFHLFAYMVVAVGLAIVGVVAGISATVQNYRSRERHAPRMMVPALAALATLGLGAILVGAIPREASAGVDPTMLAGLPAITTPDFTFAQTQLTAKAGALVAWRLDNTHNAPHSFDIDELNVHIGAAPDTQGLILFTPTTPGTYTFYCGVPGHRELGMEGTLIVEP